MKSYFISAALLMVLAHTGYSNTSIPGENSVSTKVVAMEGADNDVNGRRPAKVKRLSAKKKAKPAAKKVSKAKASKKAKANKARLNSAMSALQNCHSGAGVGCPAASGSK